MSQPESIGSAHVRKQSSAAAPIQKEVTVAVLPPRLPSGMAPPTGVGAADVFSWDESINWKHNEPLPQEGAPEKEKSFRKKIGLTASREKAHADTPPFMMRTVSYETWRKHYAKDKDGNYQGTHAPAEDCLLKPHDVEKWNGGAEKKTIADKYTRGAVALPVYEETGAKPGLPEYEEEYTKPKAEGRTATPMTSTAAARNEDGSQVLVQEFKSPKTGWKKYVQKGVEMASMGA
jgi:hypothetical protein